MRLYGTAPFRTAVVHGGPGAGGEMAPVARELARGRGVLEPIQTATSVEGQIEELRALIERYGDPPMILIGFSWGAWLSLMVTARHPGLVQKLILVGSGPFEEEAAIQLRETRNRRFGEEERRAFNQLLQALQDPEREDEDASVARLGALTRKTDTYDPIVDPCEEAELVGPRAAVFREVWEQAAALRRCGKLVELAGSVSCPVVAIHGDYDPHPAESVREPLSAVVESFRFVLLDHCGHKPWIERQARQRFFRILDEEIP